MPTKVTASDGDTLCTLGMAAGFPNCQRLRDPAENGAFLNRPLKAGDVVTIPDKDPSKQPGGTDTKHAFTAINSPPVSIRFVHGSKDKSFADDDTLATLNISNYSTPKGGANGTSGFPAGFGFDPLGDADLDAFKVEVIDPQGGGTAHVTLQAMKPVYQQNPATLALTPVDYVPFTGAEFARRKVEFDCQHATATRYRSTYLRLVVDDDAGKPDEKELPAQTLLVTDMADGLGSGGPNDNDSVEILDQQVRASYVIARCPAPTKCTVTAQVPVGTNRQRIRMVIHVFRANVGDGSLGIGGITKQMVRKRALRWFRRVYAQAGMAPRLVSPEVEFLDPPEDNMLVISNETGDMTLGDSTLSFTLSTVPPPPAGSPPAPVVTIPLELGLSPTEVGNLVQSRLPAGYQAQVFANPQTFNTFSGSCDILITRTDGTRVSIQNEGSDDALMTVTVARVNLAAVSVSTGDPTRDDNIFIVSTPEHRRVVRSSPGTGDRLDFYVVGNLSGPILTPGVLPAPVARGIAMLPGKDLALDYTSAPPIQWGALLSTMVMDGSDNSPYSFPHEAGHVMLDTFHVNQSDPLQAFQLMRKKTSAANDVAGSKRLSDSPVLCDFDGFDPKQPTPGATVLLQKINAVERLRDKAAEVQESW